MRASHRLVGRRCCSSLGCARRPAPRHSRQRRSPAHQHRRRRPVLVERASTPRRPSWCISRTRPSTRPTRSAAASLADARRQRAAGRQLQRRRHRVVVHGEPATATSAPRCRTRSSSRRRARSPARRRLRRDELVDPPAGHLHDSRDPTRSTSRCPADRRSSRCGRTSSPTSCSPIPIRTTRRRSRRRRRSASAATHVGFNAGADVSADACRATPAWAAASASRRRRWT